MTQCDVPIVDGHLHLWDLHRLRYPSLDGVPPLRRTFLLDEYNEAMGPLKISKMVFLHCACRPSEYLQEIRWVSGLAEQDRRIQGIVSWAPLEKGEAILPELDKLSRNPLVKGLRRIIQFEPDPEFCLRPDFLRGVRLLSGFGWTFDICIAHDQVTNAARFVEQCPEVRFAIDHIGKPDIRGRRTEPWRTGMRHLSEFPNVYCKVSSLATGADPQNWTIDDLKPYVEHVFECFGLDRTFFGGDWPVSSLAASYQVCVGTLMEFLAGCTAVQLRDFFAHNAIRFYGLPPL